MWAFGFARTDLARTEGVAAKPGTVICIQDWLPSGLAGRERAIMKQE